MTRELFSEGERELLQAARLVHEAGVARLRDRQSVFGGRGREARQTCREARDALVAMLQADIGPLRHEVAAVALLDAQGRLICTERLPEGKAAEVEIRPRLIADIILRTGASAMLIAHNHPSGDARPSMQDVAYTRKLSDWCDMMECQLVDHLVITMTDCSSIIGEW